MEKFNLNKLNLPKFPLDKINMFDRKKSNENPPEYPDVPGTLRQQSVDLDDLRQVKVKQANTVPQVTPYLGLPARLSQIWLNRWTILLLLVLVRVLIKLTGLDEDMVEAKAKALEACTKVEDIGSAMSSMPHYLSLGVNELSASGVEKAVDGMVKALQLAVTVIESIIFFVINMVVGTYVCLATALIKGTLDVAGDVVEKFTKAMNDGIDTIANGLSDVTDGLEKVANTITDVINGGGVFNILPDIPTIELGGFKDTLKDLENFDIDTKDFVADIDRLNEDIPDFEEIKDLTQKALGVPFEFIKDRINASFSDFKFDRSAFPVAAKQKLTFCSNNDGINSFFDGLFQTLRTGRTIFIAVIVILAIAAMAPMAWLEIKRWRRQQAHARIIEQNQYDSMDVVYIASRSMTARAGIKAASRFRSSRKQVLVRWCIAYSTTLPAIFVLSLAIAGFFACFCQWLVLRAVEQKVPELAGQVGDFAEDVVQSLQGVSKEWATDANVVMTSLNDKINDDVLGWVTTGTEAVNNTLNTFTREMEKGIDKVFGDTVLKKVAEEIINCVIGLKIDAVQRGLTWLNEQAHVEFPTFADDVFSLGASDSISGDSDLTTFLASPASVTTDEVTGAVEKVVAKLESSIAQEALISLGLLLLYVIVVLIGVMRMLVGMAMPDRTRGEGGGVDANLEPGRGGDTYSSFDDYYGAADKPKARRPPPPPLSFAVAQAKAHAATGDEAYVSSVQGHKARAVVGQYHDRKSSHGHLDSNANVF